MGRLSREAGGLGDYSENANDNEAPEAPEPDDAEDEPELPIEAPEPIEDEPA